MIRYLRAIALLHTTFQLLLVFILGTHFPESLHYRALKVSPFNGSTAPIAVALASMLVADVVVSLIKPNRFYKYINRYRYIPLMGTALFFGCLSFTLAEHSVISLQFAIQCLLVIALLLNDALYRNHKLGGSCPLSRQKFPFQLKLHIATVALAVLISYPTLSQARDFDSEVGSILDGAKVSVTLISFLGSSVRTVLRLYNDNIKVERPLLELMVNALVGTLCGWAAYLVAPPNMETSSLVMSILGAAVLPTYLLDKLTGGYGLQVLANHKPPTEYRHSDTSDQAQNRLATEMEDDHAPRNMP